ncbi:MAG: hypothetical protein ACKOXB_00210 [Flavobacteriales bacterium]
MKRLLSILSIILFSVSSYAQSTKAGNVIIGLSASKDSYFTTIFQQASTFSFPLNVEVMLPGNFSAGVIGRPIIINNVSNSYLSSNNSAKKNDNSGYLLFGLGSASYYAYNENRLLWKITAEAGYGKMGKIKYEEDIRSEIKATGMMYRLSSSLRYHLGNEYNDIYPTFFELGIGTSRITMNIHESTLSGAALPVNHSSWNALKFNTLDIALTFGFRIGKTK